MASGQNFTPHQEKIIKRYYEQRDNIMIQKLGEVVGDLYLCTNAAQAGKLWEGARLALEKIVADDTLIARIVNKRDVVALAQVVNDVATGKPATTPTPARPASPPVSVVPPNNTVAPGNVAGAIAGIIPGAPTPDILKSALKAFRKRLKLTRLDEESDLGSSRNPMSTGRKSSIVAIIPPNQFPKAVWEELARQGKLKDAGRGFYELVEGQ